MNVEVDVMSPCFEDRAVWPRAKKLAVAVAQDFWKSRQIVLRDQIVLAGTSHALA